MKALIYENKVVQVEEIEFPVHDDLYWVECDEDTTIGDYYEDDGFSTPDIEDNRDYKQKRALEYKPIGDQLDAIMKWLATETEFTVPDELKSLAMHAMSIKAKYPKPTKKKARK
jgi:hypothetical protein